MNKKILILGFIDSRKNYVEEIYKEEFINAEARNRNLKALEIIYELLEIRLNSTLKQYELNEERAFDNYSLKANILNPIRIYIEEFYLIDREDNNYNRCVRNHMKDTIHHLHDFIKTLK